MVMIQPKTNLMFVVTGKPCEGCPEMNKVVLHGPQAIDDEEEKSIICNLSMHPRKRVLSYGCYDHDPNVSKLLLVAAVTMIPLHVAQGLHWPCKKYFRQSASS